MEYNLIKGYAVMTNVLDAYSAAIAVNYSAFPLNSITYADGSIYLLKSPYTNLGITPTLNINSIGAKSIKSKDGTAVAVSQIIINGWFLVMYELSTDTFILLN